MSDEWINFGSSFVSGVTTSQRPIQLFLDSSFIWSGIPNDLLGYFDGKTVWVAWEPLCKWISVKCKLSKAQREIPNIRINTSGQIQYHTITSNHSIPMISQYSIISFFTEKINRKRKHFEYKKELIQKLGLLSKINPRIDIEHECLGMLVHSCPFTVYTNYRLGKYKIDAYLPDLRLAIEVDEYGHTGYDIQQEKTREREIRNANMVLLRFNPHDPRWSSEGAANLIKEVWKKTLSPEMRAFVSLPR